jgi:hypothetical protein
MAVHYRQENSTADWLEPLADFQKTSGSHCCNIKSRVYRQGQRLTYVVSLVVPYLSGVVLGDGGHGEVLVG